MKLIKLTELTDIKTGLVLSRKKASLTSKFIKNYKTISLKSFHKNGSYEHRFADDFVANEKIPKENLLQKGDVLIRLREPNIAVYIDEEYEDTILSSLVAFIRVKSNSINPIYLTSFLNSSFAQKQLFSQSSCVVAMMNVKFLEQIKIKVPSLSKQEQIAKIQELSNKETKALQELIKLKENYIKSIINQEINR